MTQAQPLRAASGGRDQRPSSRERGYTGAWAKASKAFLALPGNERCACGCGRPADMVDHIVAHKGDQRLFWDRTNWQPYNRRCNARKAAATEGGFGNPRGSRTPMRRPVGDDGWPT